MKSARAKSSASFLITFRPPIRFQGMGEIDRLQLFSVGRARSLERLEPLSLSLGSPRARRSLLSKLPDLRFSVSGCRAKIEQLHRHTYRRGAPIGRLRILEGKLFDPGRRQAAPSLLNVLMSFVLFPPSGLNSNCADNWFRDACELNQHSAVLTMRPLCEAACQGQGQNPFVARADRRSVCTHQVKGLPRRSSETRLRRRARAIHNIKIGLV